MSEEKDDLEPKPVNWLRFILWVLAAIIVFNIVVFILVKKFMF